MTTTALERPTEAAADWMPRALCRTVDPELFHPFHYGHDRDNGSHTRCITACRLCQAEQVCSICPVHPQCLAHVMAVEPVAPSARHGIWAGTTPSQRATSYRRAARP